MKFHILHLALIIVGTFSISARAADIFTITMEQDGSNVVAMGNGTIDVDALTNYQSFTSTTDELHPSGDVINIGTPGSDVTLYGTVNGPSNFGSAGDTSATTGTGDNVALDGPYLLVPDGYTSGSSLSDTATWDDTTLDDLGATPGFYTWTYGTGNSFVLNVVAVPEPYQYGWGILLAVMAFASWRRFRPASL